MRGTIAREQETRLALEKRIAVLMSQGENKTDPEAQPAPAPKPDEPAGRIAELEGTIKTLKEEQAAAAHDRKLLEFQLAALRASGTPPSPLPVADSARPSQSVTVKAAVPVTPPPGTNSGEVEPVFYSAEGYEQNQEFSRVLSQVQGILSGNPGASFMITGHATGLGKESLNLRTSRKQAEDLASFLKAKGVPGDRITTAAVGSTKPLVPNDGSEALRIRNRRVEIGVTLR